MDSQGSNIFDRSESEVYVSGYSTKDLQAEIARKIEWLKYNNGATLHPDWITQQVLSDHPDITGADKEFYTCCSRAQVREETRRQLNRYRAKAEAEPDSQLTLDGFTRLQQYYLVDRDQTQVAVRVDDLTDDEIDEKVDELQGMGRGCFEHADELLRFKELRLVGAA